MSAQIDTTVIIATSLEARRADSLVRAVNSILTQEGCCALPMIVANGPRVDREALAYWRSRKDVRLFELEEGDCVKARLLARQKVDTEFFGSLDDDDLYLPSSIAARLAPMRADPSVDVVVGNGVILRDGIESVVLSQIPLHRQSPLLGLAAENWMPSACAAIFRSTKVGAEYFGKMDYGIEWTALGFRLASAGHKIVFIDDLTYWIGDTPGSLSKSYDIAVQVPHTLRRLLALPLSADVKRAWQMKYGATQHTLSSVYLSKGEFARAWGAHISSLVRPGGMRYALYTRKLLRMPGRKAARDAVAADVRHLSSREPESR